MCPGKHCRILLTYCSGFTDSAYRNSVKIVQFTGKDLSVKRFEASQFQTM